jgi:DNA-binding NtrC family response regulator
VASSSRGPATETFQTHRASAYRTARLVVVEPGAAERSVVLGVPHVRIGKDESNDLVIGDRHVSRHHCEIRRTGDGWLLRDLGSRNGTRVGEVEVREGLLRSGATISVGDTHIRFLADEGRPEDVVQSPRARFGDLHGASARMREVFAVLERVAPTELTVLVRGETGTGKDLAAHALHEASPRAQGPFVVFDCGAVARNLIESELFGHVKGAFTSATDNRVGAFQRASGGTLFLDEIGELELDLQPKLLRALEQRAVQPIGGDAPIEVDVRIIAATHRNLEQLVKRGALREDLFFRLSVVTVQLPALRQRKEDLQPIAERILAAGSRRKLAIAPETMAILGGYDWPGNVRELKNALEAAAALCDEPALQPKHLMFFKPRRREPTIESLPLGGRSLESIERAAIAQTLRQCGGNKSRTARALGISPSTLYEKLKRYTLAP